jgi:thioredoxin-like negative regulator of GroEL
LDSNRLEKIEAMLVDDPGDTFLRYSRAMELAKLGRTTEGIDSLKELAAENPPYVPAFFMAAQQLAQEGLIEEAGEQLRAGIAAAEAAGDQHAAGEMREFLSTLPVD